jgi:5-methyltetrahydropteroyltriglutamate--homocysteine methyltransferase
MEFGDGTLSAGELRVIEDEAVRDVVRMQEDVGLQAATDGEFRRASWHMDFIYQLGGVSPTDEKLMVHFYNEAGELDFSSAALRIHDRIRLAETIFADAFRFLRECVTAAMPKLTIPSPSMVHYRGGRAAIDPAVYPDLELFWHDLSAAYAEQVRRLGELGCTYLQFDDTSLAYLTIRASAP